MHCIDTKEKYLLLLIVDCKETKTITRPITPKKDTLHDKAHPVNNRKLFQAGV